MKLIDMNSQGLWFIENQYDLIEAEKLNDQQFIEQYNLGLRQVVVSQELLVSQSSFDISTIIKVLRKKINALNLLVEALGYDTIQIRVLEEKTIRKIKDENQSTQLNISRRRMFMKFYPFAMVNAKQNCQINQNYLPHSVCLDMLLCTACDVCVKICPSKAISIENTENGMAYTVNSLNCDGCGECASICEKDAISLDYYERKNEQQFLIEEKKCLHCSHTFHVNYLNQQSSDKYCLVCQKYKHAKLSLRIYDQ